MSFERVATILAEAVATHACPCACLEVGTSTGVTFARAAGTLTYEDDAPPATLHTLFDLASLTKVLVTMPMAMRAVESGALPLDTRIATRSAAWRGEDRASATVTHLLEHAAGLTAHLPFYRDHIGRADVEHAIGTLPLEYDVGRRSIYSDLGFMLLGWMLEDALHVHAAAFLATLARELETPTLQFVPPASLRDRIAPTGTSQWRGRLLVGEVNDDNCAMLGGISGHAGAFGTVVDVGAWARAWLRGLARGDAPFGPPALQRRFMQKSAVPGSSRALAWDTMLPTSSCGTRLSADAVGHTGFTGTSLWIDHQRDLYIVLLTNRVHPDASNQAILGVRRAVHDAVIAALDG